MIEQNDNYICIGDIHGRFDLLLNILAKVAKRMDTHKLVFLGDMLDRGPESYEVVETIKHLCEQGQALAILGNHDQFALDYFDKGIFNKQDIWFYGGNGGQKTVDSYTKHYEMYGAGHFFKAFNKSGHLAWLKSLPHFYETEKVWFSHAPIPREEVRASFTHREGDFRLDKDLLMWTVGVSAYEGDWEHDHGKLAVCGHVHALHRWDESGEDERWLLPRVYPKIIYADTGCGCGYMGRLSAIIITDGKYEGYVQAVPKIVNDKVNHIVI